MKHVVIIGNGISGITAARHIRKRSNYRITVISSETEFFYSRTALMYVYMGHMKQEHTQPYEKSFWKKNKIDLLFDHVVAVDATRKSIGLRSGGELTFDSLIIATGSKSRKPDLSGIDLKGVCVLYDLADLNCITEASAQVNEAVIVGGGLIGAELAEMFRSRKMKVTMLVREKWLWGNVLPQEEAQMLAKHLNDHGVELHFQSEIKSIQSEHGRVSGVTTTSGDQHRAQLLCFAIGVEPNIELLKGTGIACQRGVLVDEYLQTNIPDIYAIGDCAERMQPLPGRRSVEQVWYTGRMMGEIVAQSICGDRTCYEPGPWFNSAKFFDIEYHNYGNVPATPSADDQMLYWEHPSGKKAMHLCWNKNTREFLGINSFGIRLRHELFDRWLRAKVSVDEVMAHLSDANFDPEFSERHEAAIVSSFQKIEQRKHSLV